MSPEVSGQLLGLESLPPLSSVANKLLDVLSDPNLEVSELAGIIETDPALAARIVGLSNAAFFAQVRPIYSVEEAMLRVLGMTTVRSLALSLSMAKSLSFSECVGFNVQRYWSIALISATLSRLISQSTKCEIDGDEVYLCSLLHGIGELATVHLFPQKMNEVYSKLEKDPQADAISLERDLIGLDHWQAGEWLAVRWHLPQSVVGTISYFKEHMADSKNYKLVDIVKASRCWTISKISGEEDAVLHIDGVDDELLVPIAENMNGKIEELLALAGGMS